MSIRSKVVGTLLGVFILYVFAAWLVLALVHTPAFDRLEEENISGQLSRIKQYIRSERAAVDLLVTDWAQWDDTMEYVLGDYDEYYEDNLAESYLNDLGMSFGAILDTEGQVVWGEVYLPNESISSIDYLFPDDVLQKSILLSPEASGELVSGYIDTPKGLAIISSAAILWNSGEGSPGGHLLAGILLDAERIANFSSTMLTPIDILPVDRDSLPEHFHQARNELLTGESSYTSMKRGESIYALSLLRDVSNQEVGLLNVAVPTNISILGATTLRTTISTLMLAALVLTLTLWFALKGLLLIPIEHLTNAIRGKDDENYVEESGQYLLSTAQRLTDSRSLISNRKDEIGQLFSAFDVLSSSLHEAVTKVWRVAHIDGLTGLANRRLFMERLTRRIDTASRESSTLSVLFVDLDDFKIVNDQHGHQTGDELLVQVGHRLQAAVGIQANSTSHEDDDISNIVARIGGDEFVVLLPSVEHTEHTEFANRIASNIVETISEPFVIDGNTCRVGACVGLAAYPNDANDLYGILSQADAAMYEAKRAGKSCWRRYVPGLSRVPNQKSA